MVQTRDLDNKNNKQVHVLSWRAREIGNDKKRQTHGKVKYGTQLCWANKEPTKFSVEERQRLQTKQTSKYNRMFLVQKISHMIRLARETALR